MSAIASHNTDVSTVYLTGCSGADQRKHQSSVSLAFMRGIHRWAVKSPHKGPITRKMFPSDDVIMGLRIIKCMQSTTHICLDWFLYIFADIRLHVYCSILHTGLSRALSATNEFKVKSPGPIFTTLAWSVIITCHQHYSLCALEIGSTHHSWIQRGLW